jgi:hypothetical protein
MYERLIVPQLLQVIDGVNVAFLAFGNSYSGEFNAALAALNDILFYCDAVPILCNFALDNQVLLSPFSTGKTFTLEGSGSNNDAIIPMCVSGLFQLLSDKQVRSSSRRRSANARVTTTITMQ